MKYFIEKLISRLEENAFSLTFNFEIEKYLKFNKVKEIVNQLAEEYKDRIIIDGAYCWQDCCATEHCKECNRLGNGTIDYFENYDCLADDSSFCECHSNGWISVSKRLPEDDTKEYIVQKTNGFIDILGFTKDAYKLDKYDFEEYKGKKKSLFYDYDSEYGYIEWECEAWMPLPEKYKGE